MIVHRAVKHFLEPLDYLESPKEQFNVREMFVDRKDEKGFGKLQQQQQQQCECEYYIYICA